MKEYLPSISVVIPAYNEERLIKETLESIKKSNYPKNRLETILVDDGSTDRTADIATKYKVKIIKGPHKGVGVARNLGWKNAKNNVIIFVDADHIVSKNFFKEIVKPLKNSKVGATDWITFSKDSKNIISKLLHLRDILGIYKYKYGFAKACKKNILKEVNGMRPEYGYYDDWEFTERINKKGYKIVRVSRAKLWHEHPQNLHELWRQHRWAGKSVIFLFKGYSKQAFRMLLFPLICVSFPIFLLAFIFLTKFRLFIFPSLLPFVIIEIKRSIEMFKIKKMKESFLTPLFDIFTMYLFMFGFFLSLLNIKSRPKA